MTIKAVVFDIGGVLTLGEAMDFDKRWEAELGLAPGAIDTAMADVWAAGAIGRVSYEDVSAAMGARLGLDGPRVEAVLDDMWRQYLGVANTDLIAYARGLRPLYRTGILSNSFVGAREREQALYGFGDLVDELIYSHEVGLSKPDPAVFALTCERLGVAPGELVFVDDFPANVAAATAFGIVAVLHEKTAQSIMDVDTLLRTT
jgi:FMN phosphatase YigB (HAD superfamily)